MVKRAKNATFLYKPEALRLGEGQVSTFWLMSLRLGEEKLRLCELVLLDMLCFFFLPTLLLVLLSIPTRSKKMRD